MNIAYPALPDYTGPDSGMAGCVHHNRLFEYCWSFKERIKAFDTKPAHEQETRRKCLVYLDPTGQPWAELGRQWDELGRQWDTPNIRQAILTQIRALVPDFDTLWNGKELVFPEVTP